MSPECEDCGSDLHVKPVDRPNIDWVRVVCSSCGNISDVSLVRLGNEVEE